MYVVDAQLEGDSLGEGVFLVQLAQDGDIDAVELREVKAFEGADAVHHAVFCDEEDTGKACLILRLVGGNRHDKASACGLRRCLHGFGGLVTCNGGIHDAVKYLVEHVHKVVDNLFLVGIRQDPEDVHELHDGIVGGVPGVFCCEVFVDLLVYLVTHDAQAYSVVWFGVHEL